MTPQELFAQIHSIPGDAWLNILQGLQPDLEPDCPESLEVRIVESDDCTSVIVEMDGYYLDINILGGVYCTWYQTPITLNIVGLLAALEAAISSVKETKEINP